MVGVADGGAHAGDRSPDAEETDVIRPSTRSQRETEARSGAGCCLRPPGESGRKGAAEGSCAPAVGRLLGTPAPCPPCTLEEALEGGRKWGGCRARPAPLPGPARPSPSTPSPCPRLAELCQMLWGGEAGLEGSPLHPGATGGGGNWEPWPLELEGSLAVYSANTSKAYSALCQVPRRDLAVTRLRHWWSVSAGVGDGGTTNRNTMHGPVRGGQLVQPHLPEGSDVAKVTRQGSGGATAGVSWTWRHS